MTAGEASDSTHLAPLMASPVPVPPPQDLLADKGYDSNTNREDLLLSGIRPVIPSNRSRKVLIPHDAQRYKERNHVERMIGRLKQMRRIAMRFDKTRASFLAFLQLAAVRLWLPTFVNRT